MSTRRRQGPPSRPTRGTAPLRQMGEAPWPPAARLRSSAWFQRPRNEGRTEVGRLMLLNIMAAPDGVTRAGFLSTKRFHPHAVERNRARRILREAWRLLRPALQPPVWATMVARPRLLGRGAGDAQAELLTLLARAGWQVAT